MIIMEDVQMKNICAKMVPRFLNDEQKERDLQKSQDILKELKTEPDVLSRVVTSDKSWISSTIHSPNGRAWNEKVRLHQGLRKRG